MRPPPVGGGYGAAIEILDSTLPASMRPPPVGGGYKAAAREFVGGIGASMRPPPVGGGYLRSRTGASTSTRSFNEAAARGRRIPAPAPT